MTPFSSSASDTKTEMAASARRRFRLCSRHVCVSPHDYGLHAERLHAALAVPDAEPTQGALADLFYGSTAASADFKRKALDLVRERLPAPYQQWFEPYVSARPFPDCSPLATRWSVLVRPSLDVPRRELRCSADDSRAMAHAATSAWRRDDRVAQDEFLRHCFVCLDNLAFMLARRSILKDVGVLPANWVDVYRHLQNAGLPA